MGRAADADQAERHGGGRGQPEVPAEVAMNVHECPSRDRVDVYRLLGAVTAIALPPVPSRGSSGGVRYVAPRRGNRRPAGCVDHLMRRPAAARVGVASIPPRRTGSGNRGWTSVTTVAMDDVDLAAR